MDCHNCFSPKNVNVYYKNQKSHLTSTGKWTDDLFPPNKYSLMAQDNNGDWIDPVDGPNESYEVNEDDIEWKRVDDIFGESYKVFDKIEFDDIKQGSLGNCYFLSAIAAMCEFPCLVEDIFRTKEANEKGFFEVALFIDGAWNVVAIDDYFPVKKGTKEFAFTRTHGKELWVLILEKAWAKVNGGYVNIVGGISSDPFTALTSFPCNNIKHEGKDLDELWEEILAAEQANDIMCTATDPDAEKQERVGLVPGHAYTCIGAKSAIHNGKKIRLLRIRNPWGDMEWCGDYSDKSKKWTPELKAKFDVSDADDGAFWMCIEDFVHYFDTTSICHILYCDHVKNFKLTGNQLNEPSVYNFHLKERAQVSLSAFKKHWRFNRDIRDKNHPFSIVIAQYDPQTKFLSNVDGAFESVDHTEFTKILDAGHYVIWINYASQAADEPLLENITFRVTSGSDFNIEYVSHDKECNVIREMILAGCRELYSKEIQTERNFIDIQNSYKNTGIGYVFCSNISEKKLVVSAGLSDVVGYYILHPHTNDSKVSIGINPGGVHVLIGMRACTYGAYGYCVDTGFVNKPKDGVGNKTLSDVSRFLNDVSSGSVDYDYSFDVLHKKHIGKFNSHAEVKQAMKKQESKQIKDIPARVVTNQDDPNDDVLTLALRREYPDLMGKILKLPKVPGEDEFSWRSCKWSSAYYVGQVDKNNKLYGRGAYVEPGVQTTVCHWINGKKQGAGYIFDDQGNTIYEGNFENNEFNGQGKNYLPNGDRYEGQFRDGVFSGKGCFYWVNGSSWDGYFNLDKFHGVGTYTDAQGNKSTTEYQNGRQVQNTKKTVDENSYYNVQTKSLPKTVYLDSSKNTWEDDLGTQKVERKVIIRKTNY